MCTECGCGEPDAHRHAHTHSHADGTTHAHAHGHGHAHDHDHPHAHGLSPETPTRTVAVRERVLARNDEAAEANRRILRERGVCAINLISSPGSGKTLLLEKTLEAIGGEIPCAVIAGDQETDLDARRLRDRGAPVIPIETHSACHLNAEQVGRALPEALRDGARLLFIENVGNLVCPTAFDLGEDFKLALLSVTEGEDKPLKYPALFSGARAVVVTKIDLAGAAGWDRRAGLEALRRTQPGVFVFELSAKTGEGLDAWLDYLRSIAA